MMFLLYQIFKKKKRPNWVQAGILILATDEHGEIRINTEEFNKLTVK